MNTRTTITRGCALLVVAAMLFAGTVNAQTPATSAVASPTITYQGVLNSSNGQHVPDGDYAITTTLYVDPNGSNFIWRDSYTAHVQGGVFSVQLGSGSSALPKLSMLDKQLWLGVTVGSGEELRPLTPLASVPYALNVADNSITAKKLATDYVGSISVNGTTITTKGGALNLRSGDGIDLKYDDMTNSLSVGISGASGIGTAHAQGIAFNPIGTNNDGGGPGNTNFIGGGAANTTLNGAAPLNFSTIGGGQANTNTADFTFIGGGTGNTASGIYATIGGGGNNVASGCGSFVGGGGIDCAGAAGPNKAIGTETTVGGGDGNRAINDWAIVGGGKNNTAGIVGGPGITQTVGGGENNQALGDGTAICGGEGNTATDMHSYIGGGFGNMTNPGATHSAIGGGQGNITDGNFAVVGGGRMNRAGNGIGANITQTVGGGDNNQALGDGTTIAGGEGNTANDTHSSIGGGIGNTTNVGANHATIGGGQNNIVDGQFGTVGGGRMNRAGNGIAGNITQTVGGGDNNKALGDGATIAGGEGNTANDMHSFIGGGLSNTTTVGANHGTISGGQSNIVDGQFATVGGGRMNRAGNGNPADITQTVGGGDNNQALGDGTTVAGGEANTATMMHSFIGGGRGNVTTANASHAVIGGGRGNNADGDVSTIVGGAANQTVLGATYSVASGFMAQSWQYGQVAHSAGGFAAQGDAQTSMYVERTTTDAANPIKNLALDGAGTELSLAPNQSITFRILVTARDATGGFGNSASYIVEGNATRSGAVVTIASSPVTTYVNGFGTGAVTLIAVGTTLRIQVQDFAGVPGTVRWVARVHTADVTN
ncbi:MAG: hypothetical protein JSS75_07045 [Bacteroidetes bacterium]|nr:hypothetical protein [Bacteroidota bacterium]